MEEFHFQYGSLKSTSRFILSETGTWALNIRVYLSFECSRDKILPTPLYIGFSSVDRTGVNTALTNIDLIKADLRNALLVPIRSVVGYPRYGSVIPLLPFELDSPTGGLVGVLVENAREQISNDPRVSLQDIQLDNEISTHTITLTISLYFVEFNMSDSLVLNFSTENR